MLVGVLAAGCVHVIDRENEGKSGRWSYWCPSTNVAAYFANLPFEAIAAQVGLSSDTRGEWAHVDLPDGQTSAAISNCSTADKLCLRWDVLNDLDATLSGAPQYLIAPRQIRYGVEYRFPEGVVVVTPTIREGRSLAHVVIMPPTGHVTSMELAPDGEVVSFSGIRFEPDRRDGAGACSLNRPDPGIRLEVEFQK
jgi:hypothetical protein